MAVRQIRDEKRCKICASPDRSEIDSLLELRSKGGKLDDVRVNGDYVLKRMGELGIRNPTVDNIKLHWKNHCEMVDDALGEQLDGAAERALAALEAGETVNPDAVLQRVLALGAAELEEKARNGQKTGIGIDHILKAVDSMTRRSTSQSQNELLRELGGGISLVFKKAIGQAPEQLPEAVEDAEFEEVA